MDSSFFGRHLVRFTLVNIVKFNNRLEKIGNGCILKFIENLSEKYSGK